MREIKFRAWDKDSDEMIYGVGICPDGIPYTIPEDAADYEGFDYYENSILLQYTGLKDKNGKEIYEGDILSPNLRVVEYKTDLRLESIYEVYGGAGFYTRCYSITRAESIGVFSFGQTQAEVSEIIGNIYSNPELLKEVK